MAYLIELGVPLERMARLEGGLQGWAKSGRAVPPPASAASSATISLEALLVEAGLADPSPLPASVTLGQLDDLLSQDRPTLLNFLKDSGVGLAGRQKLANALAKAKREGRVITV